MDGASVNTIDDPSIPGKIKSHTRGNIMKQHLSVCMSNVCKMFHHLHPLENVPKIPFKRLKKPLNLR